MTQITENPGILVLPPVLDLVAAADLQAAFLHRRGQDLRVEAGNVQRLGASCLQVLLAAQAAWKADGQNLGYENLSAAFLAALDLFGGAPQMLTHSLNDGQEAAA